LPTVAKSSDSENPDSAAETSATSGEKKEFMPGWSAPVKTISALVLLVGIALALPILAGFSNILGLVFIAFGMWRAWQMNKGIAMEVTGPHLIKSPSSV
jgi:hypothetical protein